MAEEATTTAAPETTQAATPDTTTSQETVPSSTLLQSEGTTTTETTKPEDEGAKPPAEKSEEKPGAPETYEFTAPEGFTLDQPLLDKFTPLFKEANVPQEVAQKIVNEYANLQKAQVEAWQKTTTVDWVTEVKSDKELGGEKLESTLRASQAAFETVFTPEERKQVETYGLLNFPPLVKAMARIQTKFMAEDKLRQGGTAQDKPKTYEQVLYGDTSTE